MESIIISLIVLIAVGMGFWFGRKTATPQEHQDPVKKRKIPYKSRYNAANLLDPITPAEQRFERKLEQKGAVTNGEEEN